MGQTMGQTWGRHGADMGQTWGWTEISKDCMWTESVADQALVEKVAVLESGSGLHLRLEAAASIIFLSIG
uniref:Uncharacterized protein n=1 Tax=Timema cristinae TaxID=61476 RepID=A0A7R9DG92_TIMCR|nr:unnamed protein product [Timema cristinae]